LITYAYTDLIEAYRQNIRFQNNPYFQYHVEKYKAVSNAFGIDFEKKLDDNELEDYSDLFIRYLKESRKSQI
jgi:hypothetical protein